MRIYLWKANITVKTIKTALIINSKNIKWKILEVIKIISIEIGSQNTKDELNKEL